MMYTKETKITLFPNQNPLRFILNQFFISPYQKKKWLLGFATRSNYTDHKQIINCPSDRMLANCIVFSSNNKQ